MRKLLLMLLSSAIINPVAGFDAARIYTITGLKGKFDEKEGVYRISFPRNDVQVSVDGWPMPPFMGLGTWAAF